MCCFSQLMKICDFVTTKKNQNVLNCFALKKIVMLIQGYDKYDINGMTDTCVCRNVDIDYFHLICFPIE